MNVNGSIIKYMQVWRKKLENAEAVERLLIWPHKF